VTDGGEKVSFKGICEASFHQSMQNAYRNAVKCLKQLAEKKIKATAEKFNSSRIFQRLLCLKS
jgi:hypothetical protein